MKKTLSILALLVLMCSLFLTFSISVSAEAPPENSEIEAPGNQDAEEDADDIELPTEENGEETTDITLGEISQLIKDAVDEAMNEDVPAWRVYIKEEVIPSAVTAIAAISAFCVAALPLVKKVKDSVEKLKSAIKLFKKATVDVNSVAASKENTENKLAALSEDIAYLKAHIQSIEKIERIGFGNMKELVVGGFASEIGKVGNDGEDAS